jgi:hypothetical protein
MAIARGHKPKTRLDPKQKLTCAYFHMIRGMAQQDLADLFGVNSGRVNEAVSAVRQAIEKKDEEVVA